MELACIPQSYRDALAREFSDTKFTKSKSGDCIDSSLSRKANTTAAPSPNAMNVLTSDVGEEPWCSDQGYLPFTGENQKFQSENQLVRAIPFGKIQKIWAVI